MAEPFKNWIGEACVNALAEDCVRVGRDPTALLSVLPELEPLALKARVSRVADALRACLPPAWPDAAALLLTMLPPALTRDHDFAENVRVWPMTDVVARYGLEYPKLSLDLLGEMTRRWSSEFAVRPYFERWPALTHEVFDTWVSHPDLHVRRLASEGARSRLPWGGVLRDAVADPTRNLARLARLVDDPSEYVRRSVANHLGDVAKDHPELAVTASATWLTTGDRTWVVRHGLRNLLKQGHAGALGVFGTVAPVRVEGLAASVRAQQIWVAATLHAGGPGRCRVDVVWRWPGVRGWCEKTFAGEVRENLSAPWLYTQRLSLRPVSTRTLRAGAHEVMLRVNGQDVGPVTVAVTAADLEPVGA